MSSFEIHTAIQALPGYLAEERRGSRLVEPFPWETRQPGRDWRGRATAVGFGCFLGGLVLLANADAIAGWQARTMTPASLLLRQSADRGIAPKPSSSEPPSGAAARPVSPQGTAKHIAHPAPLPSGNKDSSIDLVQLGAFSTDKAAEGARTVFAAQHQQLTSGATLQIEEAAVSGMSVYRLRLAKPKSEGAAAICRQIVALGDDCWAVS